MADTKISALTDGTTPAGSDAFPIARSGANNKLTWTEMLAAMPGAEIGYDQTTTSLTVTVTTEASSQAYISAATHTFDGGAVMVEFFAPTANPPQSGSSGFLIASLFEGSTQITRLAQVQSNVTVVDGWPIMGKYRFTPTAGTHTYSVSFFKLNGSGTVTVQAGPGGTAGLPPGYVRFTKV